jgi:hypothetical protein
MTRPPTGPQAWTAVLLTPLWWPWQTYLGWRMARADRAGGSDTCVRTALRAATYATLFAVFAAWGFRL